MKRAASCSVFLKINPLQVSGIQTQSADPLSFPSLCENGWSSRVVRHQEASGVKKRQARKREADRETAEAPPQSLAFSWWGEGRGAKFRKLVNLTTQ